MSFGIIILILIEDFYKSKIHTMKFFYKYENDLLPKYFETFLRPMRHSLARPSRNIRAPIRYNDNSNINNLYCNKYPIIQTNTISARNILKHNLINMLHTQTIPNKIYEKVHTHSFAGLVRYSKNHFISSYKTVCTRQNCPSCGLNPNPNQINDT